LRALADVIRVILRVSDKVPEIAQYLF